MLGLGLAGGLTDDVFDDDDLFCGLDCDLENAGDENPCLAEIYMYNVTKICFM